jgi:Protein of unknown function (DUF3568)
MTSLAAHRPGLWLATMLLAAVALANCGCLLVAAGTAAGAAAGIAYANGKVSATYFAYPNDVWAATRQGLTDLGMPLMKESFDGLKGSLESKTADGDKVYITMECLPSPGLVEGAFTRLSIRIASFGDRDHSKRIFQQIGSHVPTNLLPQPTAVTSLPGGGGMVALPVGAGVQPINATNYIVPNPLTAANTLSAEVPAQMNVPVAGTSSPPPPLAEPDKGGSGQVPKLPSIPEPAVQSRRDGA